MSTPASWFGFKVHGIIAKPGASVFLVPWAGVKALTGAWTRVQDSLCLSGGYWQSTGTQNDEFSEDVWLDAGTYKYAQIALTGPANGIFTINLDAVSQGTIDGYSAGTARNVYSEITGLTVTKSLKVFQMKMATKNGSSTNYYAQTNTSAWIRTGA